MSYIPIHAVDSLKNMRHLNPKQAQKRLPTSYEVLLGDAIERAFGAGHWGLDALVASLNKTGPLAPNSEAWTTESYTAEIAKLAKD
jgi:hypothetical protein